jgi:hypothetical protein
MSSHDPISIPHTLRKWYETKQELDRLEKLLQKYKSIIVKELNTQGKDRVSSSEYVVSRRRQTKTYLSKDSVPLDVWNKYSVRTYYDVLVIKRAEDTEKKKKKKRKSV